MKPKISRILLRAAFLCLIAMFLGSGLVRIWGHGQALAVEGGADIEQPDPLTTPDLESLNVLIAAIEAREAKVQEREDAAKLREAELEQAREDIQRSLDDLVAAEEALRARIAEAQGASEADLVRLTQVYEAMKSKDAAALFSEMRPDFAAEFLIRMAPESAAAILSSLPSDRAYAVSVVIAGRNALAAKEPNE